MSDLETLEQAQTALQTVVEAFSRLQEPTDSEPGIVTDYVLIYATQRFDDDGGTSSALGYAYPNGNQATYRTLGLIDCMRTLIRHRYVQSDDD